MRIELVFADGCTGEPDERVTVTVSKSVWSGVRAWLTGSGKKGTRIPDSGGSQRELCQRIAKKRFQSIQRETATMEITREMAEWVMVYFEMISDEKIILRQPDCEWYPLAPVVVESRRMGA